MAKSFKGIWGTFEYIDEAASAIEKLREDEMDVSVLSPCPRHELEHALGKPSSMIPFVTLVFGALGIFFGYGLPIWTSLDWVLPVSSKPIVSIPPFTIFGFELMILLGGVSTSVAIFVMGFLDHLREPMPASEAFKSYGRFSDDRFGIVVRCDKAAADKAEKVMKKFNVEEVVREF